MVKNEIVERKQEFQRERDINEHILLYKEVK